MMRSYSVRIDVTKRQHVYMQVLLAHLCELYNAALQERRDAWKVERKSISYFDQQCELTQLRAIDPESGTFPVALQRDPLRRVKRAFDGFFRRVRAGQEPGYPRFRSQRRYNSFSVDAASFKLSGKTLTIPIVGGVRLHTRFKMKGVPKELHIFRVGNKWRGSVVCDIGEAPVKVVVNDAVGIDLGLTSLVVLSDGAEIENPRWLKQSENNLARANRSLAAKQCGSKNRLKALEQLRRVHQSIQGKRKAYLHSVSQQLISKYDLIAHEDLRIKNMAVTNFGKSIMDAAWGELIWQLTYKAEKAGKWIVPVNPRGTTQDCSNCGAKVLKDIRQRRHECPHCGLSLSRDHNAALNVLQRGLRCADISAGVQQ